MPSLRRVPVAYLCRTLVGALLTHGWDAESSVSIDAHTDDFSADSGLAVAVPTARYE